MNRIILLKQANAEYLESLEQWKGSQVQRKQSLANLAQDAVVGNPLSEEKPKRKLKLVPKKKLKPRSSLQEISYTEARADDGIKITVSAPAIEGSIDDPGMGLRVTQGDGGAMGGIQSMGGIEDKEGAEVEMRESSTVSPSGGVLTNI